MGHFILNKKLADTRSKMLLDGLNGVETHE